MANRTKRTDEHEKKFLTSLSRYGNVTKAVKAARVGRTTVYEWREEDELFAKAWDDAVEESADYLEAEAYRRAVTGTRKGIYHQGVLVTTEKQYSDALLTLLLKANRPDKFRERSSVDHSGKVEHDFGGAKDELVARLQRLVESATES